MGITVFVGIATDVKTQNIQSLFITLGGTDSALLEVLIDNALGHKFSDILDKIREFDVLAQLHFSELSSEEFKDAILAIRAYLGEINLSSDWQRDAKELWLSKFEPLITQDDRYAMAC
ncbi:hypothetical protein [Agitococcus lubricus]|uniref:Uncharacterized protein n=1 Tax=Agitococcus lubricus TaxID=1077255 RepID=A0A2T5IUL5_9GAMM|nr:hypothetical protein [Agitococcus lubricus]PTQ87513.1 hypothetical protein C8N29_1188 [Agitococcus lubricus]